MSGAATARDLQLQVFVNNQDTKLIGAFRENAAGRLEAQARELEQVGVKPPVGAQPMQWVPLDAIPTLSYVYDEQSQAVRVSIGEAGRAERVYQLRGATIDPAAQYDRGFGAVLNYDLAAVASAAKLKSFSYQGVSATLDGSVSTPVGTLTQSAIVGHTLAGGQNAVRLDTAFVYTDPASARTYRLGDTVSSGLAWSRPIRIGGAQVQRNFGVRPDLVTLPLFNLSGSAAVPTTVDVYVNNVRAYSQAVDAGPYRLSDLPVTGAGTARVVMVDATGKQIEQSIPFITSPLLLRKDLQDYSVEAGFPRHFYGVDSFAYSANPVVSGSYKRGLTDWLTVEAHGEATKGLLNGGVGGVANVFGRAIVNAAVVASQSRRGSALRPYASFETRIGDISFNAAFQKSFGKYDDLASVTSVHSPLASGTFVSSSGGFVALGYYTSQFAPKETMRVGLSAPLKFDKSSVSAMITSVRNERQKRTTFASIGWSRGGPYNSSLFATTYASIAGRKEVGVFAGVSIALGDKTSASVGGTRSGGKYGAAVDVARYVDQEPGSYGWRVRSNETASNAASRSASAAYRTNYGLIEAEAGQYGKSGAGILRAQGGIAFAGNEVFATNRIDDSFAVIDAKAPGVKVSVENRPIGVTGRNGKIVAPNLRSWQENTITIDPQNLPLDAVITDTQRVLRPADRQGLTVNFAVQTETNSALLLLADRSGTAIPAGLAAELAGSDEPLVVGYDGRLFVSKLSASNRLTVRLDSGGTCVVDFSFTRQPGRQQTIGPLRCN